MCCVCEPNRLICPSRKWRVGEDINVYTEANLLTRLYFLVEPTYEAAMSLIPCYTASSKNTFD